jgi:hypothetical protein
MLALVYGLLTAAQEQQAGEVASNGSLLKVHDFFTVGLLPVVCIYQVCWRSFWVTSPVCASGAASW